MADKDKKLSAIKSDYLTVRTKENSVAMNYDNDTRFIPPLKSELVEGDINSWVNDHLDRIKKKQEEERAYLQQNAKINPKVKGDSYAERLKVRNEIMNTDKKHQITESLSDGDTNVIPNRKTSKEFPATRNVFKDPSSMYNSPLQHSLGLFNDIEIDQIKFNRFARHEVFDPNGYIANSHEILFFTKFDLSIVKTSEDENHNLVLTDALASDPFFIRLLEEDQLDGYAKIIRGLQLSAPAHGGGHNNSKKNPFVNLLTHTCKGGLSLPTINAKTIDTPTNAYGTNYEYRGSGEADDDSLSFSLEFNDNANLEVYKFFKAYDNYERLKSHGVIQPPKKYIINKVLHDQCGLYKFTLAEDYSRILHYAYYWGVFPTSVPREAFDNNIDGGVNYTVDFKAAFVDDLDPNILVDFNQVTKNLWNACKKKKYPVRHGFDLHRTRKKNSTSFKNTVGYDFIDNELVICPHVYMGKDNQYYLVWR